MGSGMDNIPMKLLTKRGHNIYSTKPHYNPVPVQWFFPQQIKVGKDDTDFQKEWQQEIW